MKCALVKCEKNLRSVDAILATTVDVLLERERRQHRVRCVLLIEESTRIRFEEVSDG